MTSTHPPAYLSVARASEFLGVNYKTARKYLEQGLFPNAWREGKVIRIPVSDLERFKEERRCA